MPDFSLLIQAPPPPAALPDTRFGGQPVWHGPEAWPACRRCQGAMQFVGQLRVPAAGGTGESLVSIFMCQNHPGVCLDWEADAGANAVWVAPAGMGTPMTPPATGETALAFAFGATVARVQAADYDAARQAWLAAHPGEKGRMVLGAVRGEPAWIQGDETPTCDACKSPMRLVAQLEEGPFDAGINFGGGCGYVFDCRCGAAAGKLVWQQ